jgi:hypothetical protein
MNITIEDVLGFLGNAINLNDDFAFRHDNYQVLERTDIFAIVRRLGKTEERYKNEIQVYGAMLAAKSAVTQPPPNQYNYLFNSNPNINQLYNPYNPMLAEFQKYQDELRWYTNNIHIYLAIKYGGKGVEWVLDKFGEDVKRWYYGTKHQQY